MTENSLRGTQLEKTWTLIIKGWELVANNKTILFRRGWFIVAITTLIGSFYLLLSLFSLVLQTAGVIQGEQGMVHSVTRPPEWMLILTPITLILYWIVSLYLTSFFLAFLNDLFEKKEVLIERVYSILPSILWIFFLMSITIITGSLLVLIPGLMFTIWYYFSLPAGILDHKKGRDALRYSHDLVRGRFWHVGSKLGGILLYTLIMDVIGIVVLSIVFIFFSNLLAPLIESHQGGAFLMGVACTVALMLLCTVIQIIATAPYMLLYRNLKETLPQTPNEELKNPANGIRTS